MPQELVFTSAPRGLRPGSSGFCTVAATPDMSTSLRQQLELLSAYRHVEGLSKQNAPVAYSLLQIRVGASTHLVLSRVADAGLDYSRRSNMLAHHLVLDPRTQRNTDPAWLLNQADLFTNQWDEEPRPLKPREMRAGESECGECLAWKELATDPGWAGRLAASAGDKDFDETAVIFRPSMDTKRLVLEALQLLPASQQWQCTFSTYFTQLPPGVTCRWRFVLEGSEEARAAVRRPKTLVIDLCKLSSQDISTNEKYAGDGPYTWQARRGERRFEPEEDSFPGSTQDDLFDMELEPADATAQAPTPYVRRRAEKKKSSTRLMSLVCGLAVLGILCLLVFVAVRDYFNTLPVPLPPVVQPDANRLQLEEQKEELQASIARWRQELEVQENRLKQLRPQAAQVTEAIPNAIAKIDEFHRKLSRAQTEFNETDQPQDGNSIVESVRSDGQSLHELVSQLQSALQEIQESAATIKGELDRISAAAVDELKDRVANARVEASRISNVVVQQKSALQPGIDIAELAKTSLANMEQELRAKATTAMENAVERSQPFKNWDSTHITLPAPRSGLGEESDPQSGEIGGLHGMIPPQDVKLALLGDVLGSGIVFNLTDTPISDPVTRTWSVVSKTQFVEDPVAIISYSQSAFRFYWLSNHGQRDDEKQLCNCSLLLAVGDEQKSLMLRTPAISEAQLAFLKPLLVSFEVSVQDYPRKCDIGVELSLQEFQIGESDPTVQIVIPRDQEYVKAVKLKELADANKGNDGLYGAGIRPDALRGEEIKDILAGESCRWVRKTIDSTHFHLEILFKEVSPTDSKAPKRLALIARLTPNAQFVPELDKRSADLSTFREVQSDINKRLESDRGSHADLPAKYKGLEANLKNLVNTKKDFDAKLKLLQENYLIEKSRLEQSIERGAEKGEFLETAIPLLQQLESQGQLRCRVFARYETHEIDLANFTGKSKVEGATTNPP